VGEAPGISRDAKEEIVGHADPTERRRIGLAQHDAAGRLEALDRRRVLGRHVVAVERRAEGGSDTFGDDQVLHRERDTVQGAEPGAPTHDGSLRRFRSLACPLGVEGHIGVQLLQRVDP